MNMCIDDFVKEIDENVKWFCDKVIEPIPTDMESKKRVMTRMVQLGWLRQSEFETYVDVTSED